MDWDLWDHTVHTNAYGRSSLKDSDIGVAY